MKKPPERAQYFIDLFEPLGPVIAKRFFGGWSLQCHGTLFAVVLRDELYFRLSEDAKHRATLEALGSAPFTYQSRNKDVVVRRFYAAPTGWLDDSDALCAFARSLLS